LLTPRHKKKKTQNTYYNVYKLGIIPTLSLECGRIWAA